MIKTFNGTLKDALTSPLIQAGDVLLLKSVTYSGDYVSTLNGTSEKPITIKPLEGAKPVIDGSLTINGSHTVWDGLEVRYSGWKDRTVAPNKVLNINGAGCKVTNCNIHDLEGVGFWMSAVDGEFSGNIVSNIGYRGPDRGHGHSVYVQNETGRKQIARNIMFNSFGWGINAYTEGGKIDNLDIVENINFQAGILSGGVRDDILIGGKDAVGEVMNGNCTYGGRLGYMNFANRIIVLSAKDNYFSNGWSVGPTVFTSNTNNTVGTVGNRVFVIRNGSRLHVAIYNEARADSVKVDVSAYWKDGDRVNAYNAQDYPNDVQALTVTAGVVAVNMQNRTVAKPFAWNAPASSFPQFGAFIMVKQ